MPTANVVLLAAIDQAYSRQSWHGTNLRGSLRRVGAEQALWRPQPERHNIWELAVHAAYWKYAVWRKLAGARRGSFPLKGSNWFPSPHRGSEREWRETVALLDRMHKQLRAAVAALPARALDDPKLLRLLTGVAAHDLYHAGQIQVVKRLRRG
jgi:hypothetical protein